MICHIWPDNSIFVFIWNQQHKRIEFCRTRISRYLCWDFKQTGWLKPEFLYYDVFRLSNCQCRFLEVDSCILCSWIHWVVHIFRFYRFRISPRTASLDLQPALTLMRSWIQENMVYRFVLRGAFMLIVRPDGGVTEGDPKDLLKILNRELLYI